MAIVHRSSIWFRKQAGGGHRGSGVTTPANIHLHPIEGLRVKGCGKGKHYLLFPPLDKNTKHSEHKAKPLLLTFSFYHQMRYFVHFGLNFEFAFVHRWRCRAKCSSRQPFKVRPYLSADSVHGADLRYVARTSCFSPLSLSVCLFEARSYIFSGLQHIHIIFSSSVILPFPIHLYYNVFYCYQF